VDGLRRDDRLGRPVERFKPTGGQVVGWLGEGLVLVFIGYIVARVHTVGGLQTGLALVVCGTVIWTTQLRPRVTAYADTLVLQNMLRDAIIPLRMVEEVSVRQVLHVWAGGRRYSCAGVGRSVRALVGHKRTSVRVLGLGKLHDLADKADAPHPEQTAMPYATFVETRIDDLVKLARRNPAGSAETGVRQVWAFPELALLGVSSAAFVVSLFL
jgi:hypothetical protein